MDTFRITRGSSKSFAWTAVWGFSLSLLPGVVARLRSEFQPKFRTPPRVLLWALGIRKHVGLIALYFLCLHACLMLLLFNSSYFGFMLLDRDEGTHGHSHMQKSEEMSMLFATISTSLFLIIGVTSLPSAAHSLNKTQAFVVFGIVVWVALLFGWLHIFMLTCEGKTGQNMECRGWFHPHSPHSWANEMPPITLMASLLPFLVFFLKLLDLTISYSKRVFWSMKRVFGRGTPFKTHPAVENLKESSEDVEGIDVELNE